MATGVPAAAGSIMVLRRCRMPGRSARKYAGWQTGPWWVALMPYSLIADQLGRDPRWGAMADGKRALRDALGWSYVRMLCETASHTDDGYLTSEQALACCDGRRQVLELLAAPILGRPPLLHQPGQTCGEKNCLDASPPWVAGYAYRICSYLKRNPAKAEVDRNKAQKDDARDERLKALLMRRDGAFCRYCRSGPLSEKAVRAKDRRKILQRDHVDPDKPAGQNAENYVTACAACNEHKGRCTPFEADMVLLPVPTPEQIAYWTERGLRLFDRPEISHTITDGSPPDHQPIGDPDADPIGDPEAGPTTPHDVPARPETAAERPEQLIGQRSAGFESGRVGQPPDGDPGALLGVLGQPVRDASSPDIYHRRSRAPDQRAGPSP